MSTLVVVGIATLAVALWLLRLRYWPYGPCRLCQRRHRGRGLGSSTAAWSHCRRCGGNGETLRIGARLWRRWRDLER